MAAVGVSTAIVIALAIPLLTSNRQFGVQDVTFDVSTDKAEYPPGEVVQITGTLRNSAPVPVKLSQANTCRNSLAVVMVPNGTIIWFEPFNEGGCLQVIVETTLGPGETRLFLASWDQRYAYGAAVPANQSYRVQYLVGYLEGSFLDETWITVQVP